MMNLTRSYQNLTAKSGWSKNNKPIHTNVRYCPCIGVRPLIFVWDDQVMVLSFIYAYGANYI